MSFASAPIPPLPAHTLLIFLTQLALLLLLALGLGRLAVRLGTAAVVGELLAGVVIGPSVLGHIAPEVAAWLLPPGGGQVNLLDAVGQFGVILLVAITGIQLDRAVLRRNGATALWVSVCGLVVPLAAGIGVGLLVPDSLRPDGASRWVFALFVGVAMCVSAIPVIAKTLADLKLSHRNVSQLILAAGIFDDTVAWFLLSVVSAMATVGVRAERLAMSVAFIAGFVVFAAVILRPLVRVVLDRAARSPESAPTIGATTVIILLCAATTHALGMEAIFGAFVGGVLVGLSGAADPARLAPLRTIVLSVLAPVFLATAGLRMDLAVLLDWRVALCAIALLAVAVLGKFGGAYLGARAGRLGHWEGLALGAGMNARGVVEVVIAAAGLRLGLLDTTMYTIIVLIAIATSVMAPPLLRMTMARVEHAAEESIRQAELAAWTEPTPDRRATP